MTDIDSPLSLYLSMFSSSKNTPSFLEIVCSLFYYVNFSRVVWIVVKLSYTFVVHMNSTKVLFTNSTKVVHTNTNSTKVVHMNSTKVVHMNIVHGKVVTHSGVATNSTCVSGAPRSCLNSRSSSDSCSLRLELLLLLFYSRK